MYLFRASAVWLLIIFAESVHGTIRQLLIAPLIGDFTARRISFFVGIILIFGIAYFSIRWINAPSLKSLYITGFLWMILTALFEFGLGWCLNYSPERIFEDYDLTRGGLMGFGLLFMIFAPSLATKVRDTKTSKKTIV
jgi:hypothetical protein